MGKRKTGIKSRKRWKRRKRDFVGREEMRKRIYQRGGKAHAERNMLSWRESKKTGRRQ